MYTTVDQILEESYGDSRTLMGASLGEQQLLILSKVERREQDTRPLCPMATSGGVCVVRACTWCDESTQPDPAPLPNIQGPEQGNKEQQQERQQGEQVEQEQQQQQQQHESELKTVAARAMHKPDFLQPIMLDHDPSIGIETGYFGKPQPQAPLELGASEPKGQWYSIRLVSAAMIVSWLALVVSLWFLPWVPVNSFLEGAVGCVPSLPMAYHC